MSGGGNPVKNALLLLTTYASIKSVIICQEDTFNGKLPRLPPQCVIKIKPELRQIGEYAV